MRITLSSQTSNAQYYIDAAYAALVRAQEQVATGKRINKPSDDPVGVDHSLSYSQSISDISQFVKNAWLSKDLLNRTSGVLDELYSQLTEVQSLAQQANNASVTPEARTAIISKLESIKARMMDLANTKHLGRYIFSGHKTDQAPIGFLHTYEGGGAAAAAAATGGNISSGVSGPGTLVFNDDAGNMLATVNFDGSEDTAQKVIDRINTVTGILSPPNRMTASAPGGVLTIINNTAGWEPVVNISNTSTLLADLGLAAQTTHGSGNFTPQGTGGTLTINGVSIAINANDTSAALVGRINALSFQSHVTATKDTGGKIVLSSRNTSNSPNITVTVTGGYSLDNIFGSLQTETVGTDYAYAGDAGDIKLQVSPSTNQTVNIQADKLFNLGGAAKPSEPDLFKLITNLEAAITSGDPQQLAEQQTLVESARRRIMVQQTDFGGRVQNIDGMVAFLNATQDDLKELRSKTEDADITQATINLQTQQLVYQASLYSASSIFKVSLMDFMK